MSRRAWIIFVVAQVVAVVCAFVTPLTIALTGSIRWFQVLFLGINVFTVAVCRYNYRKMKRLRREYIAREEGLRQRLVHARERGDEWDEHLTLGLMKIWGVRPPGEQTFPGPSS